jgi:tRNA G37 N-methylase Trm5
MLTHRHARTHAQIEVEGPAEKPAGPSGGDNSPAARLHHAVAPVLTAAEVNPVDARLLLADLPRRWERHGDLILLSKTAFASDQWREHVTPLLWTAVANALRATKIARKADVDPGLRRESRVVLLHGDDGWVRHVDNGVIYTYDATRCMFSTGNITEKVRVAQLGQEGEVVVDLYAGIGYFTLPYLVKALVQHVYACEWNPHAADALRRSLEVNGVSERCTVFEGDNAELAPRDVADRVNLGLIPTSERGWAVGCAALKQRSGGWLHVHDNVEVPKEEAQAAAFARRGTAVTAALEGLVQKAHGGEWSVTLHHAERVKSYAPRVFHVVFDIEVRPLDAS